MIFIGEGKIIDGKTGEELCFTDGTLTTKKKHIIRALKRLGYAEKVERKKVTKAKREEAVNDTDAG